MMVKGMIINKRTEQSIFDHGLPNGSGIRSDRGVVLLVVVVLSAIALLFMTTLIYMITVGTQATGIEKRYRTARDAVFGGWEITSQLLGTRGGVLAQTAFKDNLNAFNLNFNITTAAACTGTVGGTPYTSLAAKLMTPSTSWSTGCSQVLTIDPTAAVSYDISMDLGTTPKYRVYGKIVNTVNGNSGGDSLGLTGSGVINSNSGQVAVVPQPYLYTIELEAENADNPSERAKLSILYQY